MTVGVKDDALIADASLLLLPPWLCLLRWEPPSSFPYPFTFDNGVGAIVLPLLRPKLRFFLPCNGGSSVDLAFADGNGPEAALWLDSAGSASAPIRFCVGKLVDRGTDAKPVGGLAAVTVIGDADADMVSTLAVVAEASSS